MKNTKTTKADINSINNELIINIENNPTKIFLQLGFYKRDAIKIAMGSDVPEPFVPHMHNYAEIHLFLGEDTDFLIDDKYINVPTGTMLVVPKNTYHIPRPSKDTLHCAFQIDLPVNEFKSFDVSVGLVDDFFKEIEKIDMTGDHSRIASYISFFASFFIKSKKLPATRSTDYAFLIDSFLGLNYSKPIHLADLARELHISVKQAERLVILHTGCTFNTALTNNRIRAAEHLMKTTSFSISEIANLVGYESHSGFWKAYKRYREQKNK